MAAPDHPVPDVAFRDGYIDLLKRLVRRAGFPESMQPIGEGNTGSSHFVRRLQRALRIPFQWAGLDLVRARSEKDPSLRDNGMDWPPEAETMIGQFRGMVTGELDAERDPHPLGRLRVFAGVRDLPSRVKCAILPWHTLHAALNRETSASTEGDGA